MKYQVGDRVLLIHSGEEGEVIDIISDSMMMVDVEGVIFPVYMDQVDFPYFKKFTEKKTEPPGKIKQYVDDLKKEKPAQQQKTADGMWLTFLPVTATDETGHEMVKELKIHLVNHTQDELRFKYRQSFFGRHEFILDNKLNPFESFYLHDMPLTDLSDSPVFEFEFSLVHPDKLKADYFAASIKLKPKQIFDRIDRMKKHHEATFANRLFEKYPDRPADHKMYLELPSAATAAVDAKRITERLEPAKAVVDLHIEKLNMDWGNLSSYEILHLQLKEFEKYYDLAVAHRQDKLIVIHGVGEGKLRDKIHELLHLKREVKSFVNQYNPLYGFGATEIFFEY